MSVAAKGTVNLAAARAGKWTQLSKAGKWILGFSNYEIPEVLAFFLLLLMLLGCPCSLCTGETWSMNQNGKFN